MNHTWSRKVFYEEKVVVKWRSNFYFCLKTRQKREQFKIEIEIAFEGIFKLINRELQKSSPWRLSPTQFIWNLSRKQIFRPQNFSGTNFSVFHRNQSCLMEKSIRKSSQNSGISRNFQRVFLNAFQLFSFSRTKRIFRICIMCTWNERKIARLVGKGKNLLC